MKDLAFGKKVLATSALVLITAVSTLGPSVSNAQSAPGGYDTGFDAARTWSGQSADPSALPACAGGNGNLDVNNGQVLQWKNTTQNQFHARGHIQGRLTNIFPDASGHHHMEVTIGQNQGDTIEVIYNEDFGTLPPLALGQTVEACGDYITSNARSGGYAASPDGAILHWVHLSTNNHHPSGYVAVDGVAYGIGKQTHPPRGNQR